MEEIVLVATEKTPCITFKKTGELEITGKSIPEDAEDFFAPALKWLENYVENPAPKTTLSINLEYFNISSSKRILFILYKLNDLLGKQTEVKVKWIYDDHDEDMFEVGQDYAFMVKIPFEFVEIDRVKHASTQLSSLLN
jgi:hypothetical protein